MQMNVAKNIWAWLKLICVALVIAIALHQFGFKITLVHGVSMQPTLQDGERLFINRAIYLWSAPEINDIIILKDPAFAAWSDPFLIKRVIAVAGDQIEVRDGFLYRNGKLVDEFYTNVPIQDGDYGPETVRPAHLFVMGDNRAAGGSMDSRYFGQVPQKLVFGRAEFTLWPLDKVGMIE